MDIGVPFPNLFGGNGYDNGGAEDLFPHHNKYFLGGSEYRNEMSPITSPSTQSNDGGNSFIRLSFDTSNVTEKYLMIRAEKDKNNKFEEYIVTNYSDSTLRVTVSASSDFAITVGDKWPVQLTSVKHYDPLLVSLGITGETQVASLDTTGRLFVVRNDGTTITDSTMYAIEEKNGGIDTIYYSDSIPNVYTFPTVVGSSCFIPTTTGDVYSFSSIDAGSNIIPINCTLTSPITVLNSNWVVGTSTGKIFFGENTGVVDSLFVGSQSSVNTISVTDDVLFSVTQNGMVSAVNSQTVVDTLRLSGITNSKIFPPFTMVSGDLNGDNTIEVAVVDSKQGLFLLQYDPTSKELYQHDQNGFQPFPNDWAGYFTNGESRSEIPSNGAYPALADITGDGNIEIIVPGTNGVYAFSYRGIMIPHWPALLDRGKWRMRRSVVSSPVVINDNNNKPLTLFGSPTGDNLTPEISKVSYTTKDENNDGKFVAYFVTSDGFSDSLVDLDSLALFDTLLQDNDSLIFLNVMLGGLIDARTADAVRPDTQLVTTRIGDKTISPWPLNLGDPVVVSPVVDTTDEQFNLYGISTKGSLYQWNIDESIAKSTSWGMCGGNSSRTFSLSGKGETTEKSSTVASFYTYPNPARLYEGEDQNVAFRYELGDNAINVTMTIYTVDGRKVYERSLPTGSGINEYVMTDLSQFGSAPYTCRLEVEFSDTTEVSFWKMAILRGVR